MTTIQQATPVKTLAKILKVTYDAAKEVALVDFLAPDNTTVYQKVIAENGYNVDIVFENMGAKNFLDLPKTVGRVVQLAIYDGQARYVNECEQTAPYKVKWKPIVKTTPEEVATFNANRPKTEELTIAESDKQFKEVVAKLTATPDNKLPNSRCTELFEKLDSQEQLAICKIMAKMVGVSQ